MAQVIGRSCSSAKRGQLFTFWWRNGKIVRSSNQSRKRKWISVKKTVDAKKHRMDLCAAARKYRCVRRGRNSHINICQDMCRSKVVVAGFQPREKMEQSSFGRAECVNTKVKQRTIARSGVRQQANIGA